jgi:hypothetical protein
MIPCRESEARDIIRAALLLLLRATAPKIGRTLPDTCDLARSELAGIADDIDDDDDAAESP